MQAKTSVFVAFALGAILASLPYTLASRTTMAQNAGPAQGQGFPPQGGGQGFPGQGGGQGFPGQGGQGFPGGGQFRMGAMVNSMTTSGDFLFAASGDTIYKIQISTMRIEGQTKLPQPQQPQFQGGQQQGGQQRRGQGGNIPPSSTK